MSLRAAHLIDALALQPHPEGGHFREVFRSTTKVLPTDGRTERSALTIIYFLLATGEHSRVHRVDSDEIWHFYEGHPLQLVWWTSELQLVGHANLGPPAGDSAPVAVVPAGCWQSAYSTGEYTLVNCSVGPGFDFEDFQLLRDDPASVSAFRQLQPQWAHLL